jgi:hypothetical protein
MVTEGFHDCITYCKCDQEQRTKLNSERAQVAAVVLPFDSLEQCVALLLAEFGRLRGLRHHHAPLLRRQHTGLVAAGKAAPASGCSL